VTTPRTLRPTKGDLAAAVGRILFVGINPGLWSGATGCHFARPGNRFWKAIAMAGLVDRVLDPSEQDELLRVGIGITNLVARTTATAAELTTHELRAGGRTLVATAERYRPRQVAFLGISTYRVAFASPKVDIGLQAEPIAGARVWVLPNPSGLNASWTLPRLAAAYAALRD
jgi:TDG/mug DNA glycosylase family protein